MSLYEVEPWSDKDFLFSMSQIRMFVNFNSLIQAEKKERKKTQTKNGIAWIENDCNLKKEKVVDDFICLVYFCNGYLVRSECTLIQNSCPIGEMYRGVWDLLLWVEMFEDEIMSVCDCGINENTLEYVVEIHHFYLLSYKYNDICWQKEWNYRIYLEELELWSWV